MPAAVLAWKERKNLAEVNQIHFDLLATYRDDFSKYSGRFNLQYLEDILRTVPRQLGQKYIYTHANSEAGISSLKQAYGLLCKARICHSIASCSANGIPLGAEENRKYSKAIFFDVGLCSASLGLNHLRNTHEITLVNLGGIARSKLNTKLDRIEQRSRKYPEAVFNNLGYALDLELLRTCFHSLLPKTFEDCRNPKGRWKYKAISFLLY